MTLDRDIDSGTEILLIVIRYGKYEILNDTPVAACMSLIAGQFGYILVPNILFAREEVGECEPFLFSSYRIFMYLCPRNRCADGMQTVQLRSSARHPNNLRAKVE